jgi:1-acyl-sn-glycerol-3-phosphate acyltransferase
VPRGVEPPPAARKTGADYDTAWARAFSARWTRAVLLEGVARPLVNALATPERHGVDRIAALRDDGGPVIFAANHHSHLDTPVLLTAIPEPWRYRVFVGAAADYFFRTRITSAAAALVLNAIPIERTRVTRRSADLAAELIDEGWSMLIFPEGGRSPDGWGQEFRGGAAYLALRCQVPVVPVHLEGTGRILRKGKKVPTPSTVRVTFGAPVRATGGTPASARTPARRPRSKDRSRRPGDGRGHWATEAGGGAASSASGPRSDERAFVIFHCIPIDFDIG